MIGFDSVEDEEEEVEEEEVEEEEVMLGVVEVEDGIVNSGDVTSSPHFNIFFLCDAFIYFNAAGWDTIAVTFSCRNV